MSDFHWYEILQRTCASAALQTVLCILVMLRFSKTGPQSSLHLRSAHSRRRSRSPTSDDAHVPSRLAE